MRFPTEEREDFISERLQIDVPAGEQLARLARLQACLQRDIT